MDNSITTSFMNLSVKLKIRPLLFSFLTVGLFNYIFLTIYLCLRWKLITAGVFEIVSLYIAISWIPLGVWSIWYYECVLLGKFKQQSSEIICAEDLCHCNIGIRPRSREKIAFVWAVIVLIVYFYVNKYCSDRLAFGGLKDVFYILAIMSVSVQAMLTGIGFSLSLNTIWLIKKVYCNCSIVIKPYDSDGRGGLAILKDLCFQTPVLFCSGILYLPILIEVALYLGKLYAIGILVLTFIFSAFLILSYLIPAIFIYKKIKNRIKIELAIIGEKLDALYNKLNSGDNVNDLFSLITLNRYLYLDLKEISYHPINTKSVLFIFSQLLQPFMFVLIKIYLESNYKK